MAGERSAALVVGADSMVIVSCTYSGVVVRLRRLERTVGGSTMGGDGGASMVMSRSGGFGGLSCIALRVIG